MAVSRRKPKRLPDEAFLDLEELVHALVEEIGEVFSEANVPVMAGMAVCLTLITRCAEHAETCPHTKHLRPAMIEALQAIITRLERGTPTLVEGPDRPM